MRIVSLTIVILFVSMGCADAAKESGTILFFSNRYGKFAVCMMKNGRIHKIMEGAGHARWSPDRQQILAGLDRGFVVFDKQGKNPVFFPLKKHVSSIDWSDGGQVFYGQNFSETSNELIPGNIFVYDLKEKKERQMTFFEDKKMIGEIDVSADGKKVLFSRSGYVNDALDFKSYIINANGSDLAEIKREIGAGRWSPDGKAIVTSSKEGLIIYDAETQKEIRKIELPFYGSDPAFSPDGKQIVFNGTWSGIYVINIDGTGLKTILKPDPRGKNDVSFDWAA